MMDNELEDHPQDEVESCTKTGSNVEFRILDFYLATGGPVRDGKHASRVLAMDPKN